MRVELSWALHVHRAIRKRIILIAGEAPTSGLTLKSLFHRVYVHSMHGLHRETLFHRVYVHPKPKESVQGSTHTHTPRTPTRTACSLLARNLPPYVTPGELCLSPRLLRAPSLVCLGVWQLEWINSESGDSLPVELGMAVTLENSRFVPSPWIIQGKIVKFVPEHVWTPAPTDQVPEGSYDREYEKRPPNERLRGGEIVRQRGGRGLGPAQLFAMGRICSDRGG